jgi:aminopeptidase YwaD
MREEEYRTLLDSVSCQDMQKLLDHFSQLQRLTGTVDAEQAVDYITKQLETYGVSYERYEFDGYFSDPVKSELMIHGASDMGIFSKPRSASANCPEGITAELVYDHSSKSALLTGSEEEQLYSSWRGKIVLSWKFGEDYVKKLESYGVIGLIHIWATAEDAIHEETVGPVWGTPTLDSAEWFPLLPVVGIRNVDGARLIEQTKGATLKATIHSWVDYRVAKTSLPVAVIPGKTPEYILVSGHYDSWYEGVTDNAVGNAVCLEMARVFAGLAGKLERGLKIAWWPGHSNGRYMGSTWYCDHFWQDLHDHCVGHLNIDSPGSQGGAVVLPRTTRLEGVQFTAKLIQEFIGKAPACYLDIPRGADQSFWGVDVPFHLMYKYEPLSENKIYNCPGSGGGWWWHTEYDTLEKVDIAILLRDARLNIATAYQLVSASRLSVDFPALFARLRGIFQDLDKRSDEVFEFRPLLNTTDCLAEKVLEALDSVMNDVVFNNIIKTVGGRINRLMYSSGSPYDFDNTFPVKPFPGLQRVAEVYKITTPAKKFLFTLTGFIRQRNRIINEFHMLERELNFIQRD